MKITREKARDMYYRMLLIRSFDRKARELFQRDLLRGTTHTCIGQEAVAVGACAALEVNDVITSTHRGHGHCLAKGGDPRRMMAELLGRSEGYCNGKGGSMHIADLDLGILGANGIVGGSIGIATGAAYTSDYLGSGFVSICFFGDGAINQGIFSESVNMAALWKLPVVYLCEENRYAQFSPARNSRPVEDLSLRAVPFGIPAATLDGNDVLAVHAAVLEAADRARGGDGPSLLIARTYRAEGHHVGDSADYRDASEAESVIDPIRKFRELLLQECIIDQTEAAGMERRASEEILDAIEFALNCPPPSPDALLQNIYSEVSHR